jgi:hypothetical protein
MTDLEKRLGALRKSLFWQEHVAANALSAKQRDRCKSAAARLRAAIERLAAPD